MSGTRNLEGLKTQALTCIEAAYDKGYKSGLNDGNINDGTFTEKVKEAYNNGLSDAEKAMKRIVVDEPSKGGLYMNEMKEIFGTKSIIAIFSNYSMSEIINKIREYDEKKRLNKRCDTCKYQNCNRGSFPCCDCCDNDRWEAKDDEIHVGDEFYCPNSKCKYVVLKLLGNGKVFAFSSEGLTGTFVFEYMHKTGRNYPVAEILEELKND